MLRRTLLPPREAMRFSIQSTAMSVDSRPASHFSAAPSHLGVFVRDPFTFDDEGQLFDRSGTAFTFDDEHRLVTAGGDTYTYDGVGNRLQATRGGTVTRYVYDASGNLLAEANGSNQILRYYVYGQGLLAMVTPSGASYSYHYDATGNTVAMTDGSQTVVNRYAYTPYGQIVGKVEAPGLSQPFQYVGQYGVMAEPNGFYYMRARYYDPEVGRFVSEDPIGFEGGDVNLYAYVGGNPVLFTDPQGLWTLQLGFSGTGGAGGGGTAGGGIVLGYSRDSGFQFGTYKIGGGGGFGGVGGSVSLDATWSGNTDINQLSGIAGTVGGSVNVLPIVSAGGEVGFNEGAHPSYTGSLGFGGGPVPFEQHGFVTRTWINEWTNNKP